MADCYMVLVSIRLMADMALGYAPLDALNLPV